MSLTCSRRREKSYPEIVSSLCVIAVKIRLASTDTLSEMPKLARNLPAQNMFVNQGEKSDLRKNSAPTTSPRTQLIKAADPLNREE